MPSFPPDDGRAPPRRPTKADYLHARRFRSPLPQDCREWLALKGKLNG